MFPRMNFTNPFQSFGFGVPQYGVGFGGINPIAPHLAPPYGSYPIAALNGIGVNPYTFGQSQYVHPLLVAQLQTTNPTLMPLPTQHSAIGQSPYGVWGNSFGQGISPLSQQGWGQQFGGGIGQFGSPLSLHTFPQQAIGYPAPQQGFGQGISPLLQQGWGQQFGGGIGQFGSPLSLHTLPQQAIGYPAPQQGFGQGISPLLQQGWGQQFGGGIGQFGSPLSLHTFPQQAFGIPALQQGFGWGAPTPFNAPVLGVDPITGALIVQQPSLLAQSQLPIRPLITPQQADPFQMAASNGVTQYGSPTPGVPF